jgi:hypothetical protein
MKANTIYASIQDEDQVVAELEQLGVSYLSRQNDVLVSSLHKPEKFLACVVCQPSSRVRSALIALLLARPDYAQYARRAVKLLDGEQAQAFRLYYSAAVCLRQKYAGTLQAHLGGQWRKLPDLFSVELGVSGDSPAVRLRSLARIHVQTSGEALNWAGTYENAAQHLILRWEKERLFTQSNLSNISRH